MAATRGRSATRKSTRVRGASPKRAGEAALKRLDASLDAAQTAVKDLRSEMSRTGKDLFADVQKLIADARRDTRRMSRSALKDLDELQETVRGGRPTSPRGKARTTGSRKKGAPTKHGRSTARRKAGARSASRRSSSASRSR
jgi:hypothetical protein